MGSAKGFVKRPVCGLVLAVLRALLEAGGKEEPRKNWQHSHSILLLYIHRRPRMVFHQDPSVPDKTHIHGEYSD